MSHELFYDKELRCDNCKELGAFDFMGDYYCTKCLLVDEDGTVIGVDESRYVPEQQAEEEEK